MDRLPYGHASQWRIKIDDVNRLLGINAASIPQRNRAKVIALELGLRPCVLAGLNYYAGARWK